MRRTGNRVLRSGAEGNPVRIFHKTLIVSSQGEARLAALANPDQLIVVRRGRNRSAVFACPCWCRDVLVLNLDRAAGPAWRLRFRRGGPALMPSIWRTTGCKSHFIVWDGRIWWCGLAPNETENFPKDVVKALKVWWDAIP